MGPPDKERRPRREGGAPDDVAGGCSHIVAASTFNRPVLDKLLWLRDRHGYFSRADLEEALGLPSPHGHWVCNGEFGPGGQWQPHCTAAAS